MVYVIVEKFPAVPWGNELRVHRGQGGHKDHVGAEEWGQARGCPTISVPTANP